MPRHPPKPNSEPPQTRPNNSSTSPKFPRFSRRSKRTSRPATAFATLALLASVAPSPISASPVPFPFLEFLYPSFLPSCPTPATPSSTRHQLQAQQPPREPKDAVASRKSRNKGKQTEYLPNVLSKRSAAEKVNVPVKYESVDVGWVIAESWDLHGHHRRSQTTSTDPVGPTNIQNLDAADSGNSIIEVTDALDLPYGWDTHGRARHESYDPVIVSVFAVVLVFAIVLTTGLCRWRSKKARRLRDLEQLEQEQKSDASSDSSSIVNEKPGKTTRISGKKIRNSIGKSTGFKRIGDRLTARMRRKRRAKNNTVRPGDDIQNHPEPATARDLNVVASRHEAIDSTNGALVEGSAPNRNRRSQDSAAPLENSEQQAISSYSNNSSAAVHDSTASDLLPQPLPSQPPLTTTEAEETTPTALPPAYRSNALVRVRSGKAPIRGFEEDYDERSLTGYRRSSNPALPLDSQYPLQARRASTSQFSQITSAAPPFEPFEQPHGAEEYAVEIGNGATRRAHVATDDKAVLERMRRLANEPSVYSTHPRAPVPGPSSPTSLNPSDPILPDTANVPAWSELDEFDVEQQLDAHRQTSIVDNVQTTSSGTNLTAPPTPSNARRPGAALHLPPPPSPSTFIPSTLQGTGSEEDYGFGHVWAGLGAATSADSSLHPSAPPSLVDEPSLGPSILPSAPPFEASDPELPSAPPAWDEDLDIDVPNQHHNDSSGPLAASSSMASTSANTPTTSNVHIIHTDQSGTPPSNNARWSLTLGTRAEEGAGLPRYEP